ncbi:GumC family protein [Umezakia ovalisporum]|jgi:capsular exopolysaccharide synthesis family protein|uniref:Polysaccharide biosynthesis tyrosine autokinase n=2 Tax=Umezakia ovalisporum TaxID=75695 RepID=A0AA43GZJ9_9CYAN|nr:polysaccharide biosynthesis tyrosine autokinase [Umezakia ovalisporum]MBI1241390.1 polysaccharide biosynthesis tyrosine autokinase [Nostoc sp. RI_552]MDH6057176.1 polysaccharide biosynthesis tyrosine autokinase [Umezakia ovalisporum FSS-43]MDH6064624.1 polysaccharide biosynthesis tyrosine autokinase [Umezakia ovalisporum FSS-62]MDH6069026.1 polysaccharide biosynthesis tyrosine autokinase [Umezakia ovalisporum APH033B]MDH6071716.1 polysaccharide biosynthesis tyrosine autokinase [Umezakia ova
MNQASLSPGINHVNNSPTEPSYGQLFKIFIRRFPWFLAVFISSIAIAALVTSKTKPTYKSSMQLLVEPNYQGRQEGIGADNQFLIEPNIQIDTATQLNLMQSSGLIEQAVDKLQSDYPNLTVNEIKKSLLLNQLRTKEDDLATKIFQVDYTAQDPQKTQKVLETIGQVYLEYNQQQQNSRLQKGLQVVREQLSKASEEVNASETNLQRFRRNQNLIDPESQAKALEDSLNTIEQDRRATRSQYQEALARQKFLQEQLNRSPQNALVTSRLSQSTRYQGLLNEIQKTELALAQERLRFTDETPNVQQLQEQLESQKKLLQQEVGRTLGVQSNSVFSSQEPLLEQGQFGEIDLNLATQLVETQTIIVALSARDQTLAEKENQLRAEIKRFPPLLAYYNRIMPQLQFSRERLEELLRAEQKLRQELAKGGFNWEVVEEPQLGQYLGPNLQQNLLLGAVVGLMLGGVAAFIREASDDAVYTTAELEKQVSLPLLGTTPKLPTTKHRESIIKLPFGKPEVLAPWTIQVLQSPPRWESLDLIFKNIELLNSVTNLKSLMITSALPDDSKSALALGLAMSAARLHKRVLLIDANLRAPSLHEQLNLPNDQGLSTLLANDITLPNQIGVQTLGSAYIDILTAGPTPIDPANLLSSPRMKQLMKVFEDNYDLVLIDASPVIGLVDAMLTASSCRSVVLAASMSKITRSQLAQATAMLSKLNLIGVVANGVSNSGSTYVRYPQPSESSQLALEQAVEK